MHYHSVMIRVTMFIILLFVTVLVLALADNIDRKHAKCLVCHRVVEELFNEISGVSTSTRLEKGRNAVHDKITTKNSFKVQQSEMYFGDIMDHLCKKMGEYVRVFNKTSGQLDVVPLIIEGKMNVDLGSYEIIKDGDIESIEFYCESIISEYEEEMLQLYKDGVSIEKFTKVICLNPEICKPTGFVPLFKDEL